MTDRTYYLTSASIVFVVTASVAWIAHVEAPGTLSPDSTEMRLGQLAPAQLVKVPFRLHNGSSRPVRIVGASMTCKRFGCLGPESFVIFPLMIPPGGDGVLNSAFRAGDLGNFTHPMVVFSDCKQALKIVLSVSGQVVASPGEGDL